jgi:hypothetical protein
VPRRGTTRAISKTTLVHIDGRSVSDEKLIAAANAWVAWERKYPNAKHVNQSAVALAAGYSTVPEWFDSVRFKQAVELVKFEQKVLALQARPEINTLVSDLISLGMLEAQRRLILNPSEIPATVLYGDILHKWPKMLHDLNADKLPAPTGDVFNVIVQEINMISDRRTREDLRKKLVGKLEDAVLALKPADPTAAEETIDASVIVDDDGVPAVDTTPTVEVGVDAPNTSDRSGDSSLWDDPALD